VKNILVIAEIFQEKIRPVTWELITAAYEILRLQPESAGREQKASLSITVIVPARNPLPLAEEIAQSTGLDVIGLSLPDPGGYSSYLYIESLSQLIQKLPFTSVVAAHTAQGRDFAPGLSIRIDAAAIPGVTRIRLDDQKIVYVRPALNNSQNMVVHPDPAFPVVLTIAPGVFKAKGKSGKKKGKVTIKKSSISPERQGRVTCRQVKKRTRDNQVLKTADIVVGAGRGIEDKENLALVNEFSKLFPGAAVGASRPLVDMGWIGYGQQVGITGAVVSPKLYIACGISGSSQHLAGMGKAKIIISINKNPGAPICRHSDLCITEDVMAFIRAFLQAKKTHDNPS
jgi:electron transfer flavoprotein alpha subunit